jgi:L-fuculose-phosphate aldolase
MTMMTETEARNDLVRTYRHIVDLGLTELSSGNMSIRYRDGMLISPAGATRESINVDNVVYVSAEGKWDPDSKPSSEWQLHSLIYHGDSSTNAVVHTHSDNCVAVACHCRALPAFHYLVGVFGGMDVPCVPYSTFGSEKLAKDVAGALVSRSACLMANHGMTARGPSLDTAVTQAHRLEILCRQYLLSRALGEPRTLTAEEMTDFYKRVGITGYGK